MTAAYPVFPTLYGYSVNKRPTFSTIIPRVPRSGREVTRYQTPIPLWEFELRSEILRDETQNISQDSYFSGYTDLQDFMGLFLASAGQFGFFFFEDTSDNSRLLQGIGTGDGSEVTFPFVRTITSGSITYTEPVGGVNLDHSLAVYVNGIAVPQLGNWSVSTDQSKLVFVSPPANDAVIQATFYYYYLCRFINDEVDFEEFLTNRWSVKSIRFRSVNIYGLAAADPLDPPPIPPTDLPRALYIPGGSGSSSRIALWRGSALSGAGSSSQGTVSVWIYPFSGSNSLFDANATFFAAMTSVNGFGYPDDFSSTNYDGFQTILFSSPQKATGFVAVQSNPSNRFKFRGNGDPSLVLDSWHHICCSWDTNFATGSRLRQIVIDGTLVSNTTTVNSGSAFSTDWSALVGVIVGNSGFGTVDFPNGSAPNFNMAELYINLATRIDLSISANVQLFRTLAGKPANLGSNGSTPTGSSPAVYLSMPSSGAASQFATNNGVGGNFNIFGTLTRASSDPF